VKITFLVSLQTLTGFQDVEIQVVSFQMGDVFFPYDIWGAIMVAKDVELKTG